MKWLAFLLIGLLVAPATAQTSRRVPLIGYADRDGNVVEPATWEWATTYFVGDWVGVSRHGKSGFLNLHTRATTGLIFDGIDAETLDHPLFANGPEPVLIGGNWGYADETGRIAVAPRFAGAKSFDASGLAVVQVRDPAGGAFLSGVIDRDGLFVVQPRYEMVRPFNRGKLTVVSRNGRFGAIDRTGKEVVPLRFGGIGTFAANGLAPATVKGGYSYESKELWGYIDTSGQFVIPERFRYADNFVDDNAIRPFNAPPGLARVGFATGEGAFIDAAGRQVTHFPVGVNVADVSPNGLVRFQGEHARYGFADARTGAIVIPARLATAGGFDDHGLAAAKEGDRAGYIRADGEWSFPPRFTSTTDFDALGQAQVFENGRWELIDRDGGVQAILTHGERFFPQGGAYAHFRVFPGREDAPTQRFGDWSLDAALCAVPEMPAWVPTPTGDIRLSFASDDDLVRWSISTEGWVVTVRSEEGAAGSPDVVRLNRLAELPGDVDALMALLIAQFASQAGMRLDFSSTGTEVQAARAERVRHVEANRTRYLAQLRASAPDLAHGLAAMRARITEQFGKLSGEPCRPPQCLY